jgi:ParB family chromosome partitioning protein
MNATLLTVPIEQVLAQPQARKHFDDASIAGLAASIRESGLQQPLLCRKEGAGFPLIDGERRLRACRLLEWKEVPILVAGDRTSVAEVLTRQLACNLQREDLSVVERADAIRALMQKASLTADQVAKRLGQSPATVSRTLSVLKLPEPLLAQVTAGQISADAAYMLARVDEPGRQAELAAEVVGGKLSRDALTRKLKRVRRAEGRADPSLARVTAALGGGRSFTLAGKALSLDTFIESLEQLLTRARKSKSQGLTLATFIRTLRDQAAA